MAGFRYIIFQIKKERTHAYKTTPTLAGTQTNIYLSSAKSCLGALRLRLSTKERRGHILV